MGNINNNALSLLVVNGELIYIGCDNSNTGLQVWRTSAGVTDRQFESDFEHVATDDFEDPAFNQQIYHGLSIADKINDYLWLFWEKSGDSLQVYRTKNDN